MSAALVGACLMWAAPAHAYSALYVFGDSLSDVGNVYVGTSGAEPASPYVAGRFTNGPNWVDDLSAKLVPGTVSPSLLGGNDFAYGGATASTAVPAPPALVPNVVQQVGQFSMVHGGTAPSDALYAMWIGSNDVIAAIDDLAAHTLTPTQAVADLTLSAQAAAGALHTLALEGATDFLVGLVPDLGLTPGLSGIAPTLATSLSSDFNKALVDAIGAVIPSGAQVSYFDTFKLLDDATSHPGAFGLSNVTDACYTGPLTGGGSVCADPSKYLFWDDLHPTTVGHEAVAGIALSALSGGVSSVPLPASVSLYGSGLVILAGVAGWSRARRALNV